MSERDERADQLRNLCSQLGLSIRSVELYDRALTHASIVGETGDAALDYESLEFLGDAVLGLAVAHDLFARMPDRTPGEYSRMRAGLVNRQVVARVGLEMGIAEVIRLGKGEERSGGRQRMSLIADCTEALIGAIYLDSGWDTARAFVLRAFREELEQAQDLGRVWDYKSRLQHYCQAQRLALPEFTVIRSEGPDHKKEFEVEVVVGHEAAGRGRGPSKKEAEQLAAREALERVGIVLA